MTGAIILVMLRRAGTEDFPVIDLGAHLRGEAGASKRSRRNCAKRWKTSAL